MGSSGTNGEPNLPETIKKNGDVAYLIDGWAVDDPHTPRVVKFGILQFDMMRLANRAQNSAMAQFDGIVAPGLIVARHIFRGLKRPLYADGSMEADSWKLVHTWRPAHDFDWPNPEVKPRRLDPVKGCVFVVLISKNELHLEKWPEVYGWIDRWNWVYEDAYLSEAPLNWFASVWGKTFHSGRSITWTDL